MKLCETAVAHVHSCLCVHSFMMVRAVVQDAHCPVELLCEDEAYHLVRESHLRERNLFLCRSVYGRRESVGTAYDENQPLDRVHLPFYPGGELDGAEFFAVLVKQYRHIAWLEGFQYQFAFLLFLLFFAEAFGVLQFGDDFDVERDVMLDARHVG